MNYAGKRYTPNLNSKQQRAPINAILMLISCMCIGLYFGSRTSDYEKSWDNFRDKSVFNSAFFNDRPWTDDRPPDGLQTFINILLPVTYIGSALVHLCLIVAILAIDKFSFIIEIICTAICLFLFVTSGIMAVTNQGNLEFMQRGLNLGMSIFSFFGAFVMFVKIIVIEAHLRKGEVSYHQAPDNGQAAPAHSGATFGAYPVGPSSVAGGPTYAGTGYAAPYAPGYAAPYAPGYSAPYAGASSPGSDWARIDSPPKYEDVKNVKR